MANILIVEDDDEIAETVAELLTPEGHVTRTAPNGVAGLRMIAEEAPDLILLDLEMPVLDGPGMMKALAIHRDGQPPIPLVVVSAARDIRDIADRLGARHYVRKPFSVERLLEIVTLALALRPQH